MTMLELPKENLIRALTVPMTVRADTEVEDSPGVLFGEFARFNEWTEIDSYWEGNFLERISPTAFDWTLAEGRASEDRVRCIYEHGYDPQIGAKVLGLVRSMAAGATGMDYEVDLIDTDYNRDYIAPAARAGLLGASFRMQVLDHTVVEPTVETAHNPKMLPERTVARVELFEFGPTPTGYYPEASSKLRSATDEFLARCHRDPAFMAGFAERTSARVAEQTMVDARALMARYDVKDGSTHGAAASIPAGTHGDSGIPTGCGRSVRTAELELLLLRK